MEWFKSRWREVVIFCLLLLVVGMGFELNAMQSQLGKDSATIAVMSCGRDHLVSRLYFAETAANNAMAWRGALKAAGERQTQLDDEIKFLTAWRDEAGPRELRMAQQLNEYVNLYGMLPERSARVQPAIDREASKKIATTFIRLSRDAAGGTFRLLK